MDDHQNERIKPRILPLRLQKRIFGESPPPNHAARETAERDSAPETEVAASTRDPIRKKTGEF